jgi:hypothetical protein
LKLYNVPGRSVFGLNLNTRGSNDTDCSEIGVPDESNTLHMYARDLDDADPSHCVTYADPLN